MAATHRSGQTQRGLRGQQRAPPRSATPMHCVGFPSTSLPSALDVRGTFLSTDQYSSWGALALDVKAARKRIKVRASDQGALLFAWQNKLFQYTVCHFGAKFSAYWWRRIGAQLVRILHCVLKHLPHRAWLYVDDLLLLLHKANLQDSSCVVISMLSLMGVPISWRKAQLGACITWCGWMFDFDRALTAEKLIKLRAQLMELRNSRKILRKSLESSLGLLMWDTSAFKHLRPYLAPLYKDLPMRAKVINVGSIQILSKADVPKVPPARKATWVRISDPRRTEIHLRDESKLAIDWLLQCFARDRVRTIRQKPALQCYAAADAMAKGETFGVGG